MNAGSPLNKTGRPAPLAISDTSPLRATLAELARRNGWRLVVDFGSAARGEAARDLDLAVLPAALPSLLTQGAWFAGLQERLAPRVPDMLLLGDDTSPVAWFAVFRRGRWLFEAEPGLFLSAILGVDIPANRVAVTMEQGDQALILRLRERLPEDKVLSEAELATLPCELAWLERVA